jgi:hypothetical protein
MGMGMGMGTLALIRLMSIRVLRDQRIITLRIAMIAQTPRRRLDARTCHCDLKRRDLKRRERVVGAGKFDATFEIQTLVIPFRKTCKVVRLVVNCLHRLVLGEWV